MRSLLYMLVFVVGYFVVMFFTASETLFECSGSYDKSKPEIKIKPPYPGQCIIIFEAKEISIFE